MTELLLFYRSGWFFSLSFPPANPGSWRWRLKFFPVNSFHVLTVESQLTKKEGPQNLCDWPRRLQVFNHLELYSIILAAHFVAPSVPHSDGNTSVDAAWCMCSNGPFIPAAIVWLFQRPFHPRACELDITIPITGLTRRVSAAHLPSPTLPPFIRRERLTPAKVEDTFNICCRFRLSLLEMKWISHVGEATLAFYKCRARGKTRQSHFYCLMTTQNIAVYGSRNEHHLLLCKQDMLVVVGITCMEMCSL